MSIVSRCVLLAALLLAGCATQQRSPDAGTPSPARPVERAAWPRDAESKHCLALAMYWEARGEGREGMAAVGAVVLNRVADRRFPDTVCGVVHQGGETPPCQFSWWCDGKSDRPTNRKLWESALALADELLARRVSDPTQGALFFHSTSIRNPWKRTRTARIGNHAFYK